MQESALHLPIGGRDVWWDQLHHLLRMRVRPNIRLRIVPTSAGAHPGLAGSFLMMKFAKLEPVVHVEGENSSLFMEDKASIGTYSTILEALDRIALDEGRIKEVDHRHRLLRRSLMTEWRRSSYTPNSSDCVEVGRGVGIRDSKGSRRAHAAGSVGVVGIPRRSQDGTVEFRISSVS